MLSRESFSILYRGRGSDSVCGAVQTDSVADSELHPGGQGVLVHATASVQEFSHRLGLFLRSSQQ